MLWRSFGEFLMTIEKITLTEEEFAERVGVSRITIWRLRREGKVAHYKIGTRVLYSEMHVSEFLSKHERAARGTSRNAKAA
jgi:putative molybdopterin biosynthesis protein